MMNKRTLPRLVLFGLLAGTVGSLSAQSPSTQDKERKLPSTNSLPPLPPPALDFRQLLAMPAAEREKLLASKSPQHRRILETKMLEYESLKPEEREPRLRTLQVRLHLRQLIKMPPSNRVERLATIAEPDRKLIEERLEQWDQLPKAVQQEVLQNQWPIPPMPIPSQVSPVANLSAKQRQIESEMDRWNALPRDQRQQTLERFKQYFDELSDKERAKVLNTLSAAERQQMEKTLQDFERLPKAQRDRCIAGFQKFADLPPEERQQFLKNAERWQTMSEKDRVVWRTLVSKFSSFPPLPPRAQPGTPPLPSAARLTNR